MEKNIGKNKYEAQDKYIKKTYIRPNVIFRKEWNLYDTLLSIAQKKRL